MNPARKAKTIVAPIYCANCWLGIGSGALCAKTEYQFILFANPDCRRPGGNKTKNSFRRHGCKRQFNAGGQSVYSISIN